MVTMPLPGMVGSAGAMYTLSGEFMAMSELVITEL